MNSCFLSISQICIKFIICCIISLGTMALGIVLIAVDRFQNQTIALFATNLIILNLTFWLEPPRPIRNNSNEI